ncbi:DUF6607 family protein [Mangrovivirga cuniculi]|uniref:DKNYY family protein n=1 Tax=Mangrovivirga cuniculi TaxID=2715131 RepID=A0A4D7JSU0_9BACT|nr:DUF6607 family protein [Mangrovivirga cuniculi]QCK16550.1 hypothetical protein DCC35_18345 [Mangrovivirga cuniculi]
MKKLTLFLLLGAFSLSILAQSKKQKDLEAIKNMCGCYEVSFNFAETFNYSEDSTYKGSEVKHSGAIEWVQLVEDSDNKLVLQHLLVVGSPESQKVIKHWRQDWLYENPDLYMYQASNKWKYVKKADDEVKGQWTQKVYQVDDSPRYEGSATWVHVDGKSYWENTTDAPLPRREYTKRDDYNLTVRTNRHQITETGWIHEQDNDKVIRTDEKDFVLAQEKGYNFYTRVDDEKCKKAKDWWKNNQNTWKLIRSNWDEIFAMKQDVELKNKVEGKRLFEYIFALDKSATNEDIKNILESFIN